jgi:hypothetical protein
MIRLNEAARKSPGINGNLHSKTHSNIKDIRFYTDSESNNIGHAELKKVFDDGGER